MPDNKNSAARIQANNKYNAKAYDRINIAIPKGRKATVEEAAVVAYKKGLIENKAVNGLMNLLLREYLGLTESEWKSPGEAVPEDVPVENAALEAVSEDSSDIPQKEPAVDVEAPPAVEAASVEPVANPLSKTKDSDSGT